MTVIPEAAFASVAAASETKADGGIGNGSSVAESIWPPCTRDLLVPGDLFDSHAESAVFGGGGTCNGVEGTPATGPTASAKRIRCPIC